MSIQPTSQHTAITPHNSNHSVDLKAAFCRSRAVFSVCKLVYIMYNKDVANQSADLLPSQMICNKERPSAIAGGLFLLCFLCYPLSVYKDRYLLPLIVCACMLVKSVPILQCCVRVISTRVLIQIVNDFLL